jgi:hypothetical protein
VAGHDNAVSSEYATVGGGYYNSASGAYSSISGGGQLATVIYGLTESREYGWRAGNSTTPGVPKYLAP